MSSGNIIAESSRSEIAPPSYRQRHVPLRELGELERVANAAVGGFLVLDGMRQRPVLRAAMTAAGAGLLYRGISGQGVSATRALEYVASPGPLELQRAITVNKPAEHLYRFWRQPENLKQIFGDLAEVTTANGDRAHWKLRIPVVGDIEWDTRILEDRPGELLHWRSLGGAGWYNEAWVRFRPAPADWGTEVHLRLRFRPPAGAIGKALIEGLNFVPRTAAKKALARFKSLLETGEIPTLRGNPSARGSGDIY